MTLDVSVHFGNAHSESKLDRAQKAWLPSTIITEESDRAVQRNAGSASSTARRKADRDDVSIAPSISDDEDDEPDRVSGQDDQIDGAGTGTLNDSDDGDDDEDDEDESNQPLNVAATREEPNPADNPGLPLLWNVTERSETVPRTFSPPPVRSGGDEGEEQGDSSEEDKSLDLSEGEAELDDQVGAGHVELIDVNEDIGREPAHGLVASPEEELPSHSPSPSPSPSPFSSSDVMPPPGLPTGPRHRPTTSTSLYPKPRLLSSDSKVRFSPRVRVKSGLRGGAGGTGTGTGTGSSRMGSRVPSSASVVPSGIGANRNPSNPDVGTEEDVFYPKSRASSGHSRIGAMTTLDDPPASRPSSHRNPSYTGMESTSLTSSASISLCASPPQNSWLFSGNSLSAALAGINSNNNNNNLTPSEERLGPSAAGTDYFSFPASRPIDPSSSSSRQSSLNLSNPSLVRGRSTLTPRDPEIEKLSADAARKRAESWAREHAPRSAGGMRRSASLGVEPPPGGGGAGAGGFRTPPLESPSFESSRRTASGGILIRTYSGRYLPPSSSSSMNANEVHYKTEQQVIWGSYWDRIRNPRWWSWKAIRGWKVVVGFWCGGDDDDEEWEERRAVLRRPPRRAG